ncbi:MAG: hypothetical protein K2O24_03845 [Muribaculaceae bacterium]|nr:hypothetical protein [Muribaculaceae bacterium]
MRKIHLFNPDTDYALASGLNFYTPPASVLALRSRLALLPSLWASPGDSILLLDPAPGTHEDLVGYLPAARKGLTLIPASTLSPDTPPPSDLIPTPWGWNRALRTRLLTLGFAPSLLPSEQTLDTLRSLSHRRSAGTFNRLLGSPYAAEELFSVEEVREYVEHHPDAWLKAPWSSSGRGIISCGELQEHHILPWARGIIRRQGSVMAERGADRVLDFASEWICSGGETRFEGLSVFRTSSRGKYHGNLSLRQHLLEEEIRKAAPGWDGSLICRQKEVLDELIAPFYDGPLGIDMLADRHGRVRPCVEINLRMTMGHVALFSGTDFAQEFNLLQ